MLPLLLLATYLMVYVVIIPLGIVGLVQFTRTTLLLILTTALMTGGLGTIDSHYNKLYITECLTPTIPDRNVVMLIGSLVGPGNTVNAYILQLYSVNGVSIVIVTVVPLIPIYVHKICWRSTHYVVALYIYTI